VSDDSNTVTGVEIELRGLSVYTHHGVTGAEREVGQRLEIDLVLGMPECDAVASDRIEDTVDYADVVDVVVLAATEQGHRTIERVAGVIAERVLASFDCENVRVRVAKPEPPLPVAIEDVAVEVLVSRSFAPGDDD